MDTPENTSRFAHEAIASNIAEAKRTVSELAPERDVKLLAVTKTVPVEVINYAIDELGINLIGENRVQELLSKYELLHSPKNGKLEIHLIGSLQTNKVKYIIDKVDMIESVDSERLAAEIDRLAKKHSLTMDILVEVNIGCEEQKGGVLPDALEDFVVPLADYENLRIRGLMTIAPRCDDPGEYSDYFLKTRELFESTKKRLANKKNAHCFDTLSMGMSGSYREALSAGSTEIRLGSALFGARQYVKQ